MTRLYFYTAFHANLKFSSIPEDQYSSVLDKCYWPMLDSLKDYNFNLGFEFPASTLEIINSIDSGFIKSLSKNWHSGRCEVLGSGYSQTIFPLNPAKANLMNISQGNKVYKELLGNVPQTGYVNEQTFSSGIVGLYKEVGYQNLIIDWDNAKKFKNFPDEYAYEPKVLLGEDGSRMNLIWNSSIAFQKFQRYAQGSISFEDYLSYLESHQSAEKDRAFLLYGYDLEIFDYRPGHGDLISTLGSDVEFQRILRLFDYINENDNYEIITPSEIVEKFKPNIEVELGSPQYPIITKKQEKYNVTRWAVCGRENSRINGQCYHLFNQLKKIEKINKMVNKPLQGSYIDQLWLDLTNLWSSDFRTHTTDQKYMRFRNQLGAAMERTEKTLLDLTDGFIIEDDFVLINPHSFDWKQPFEFTLQLPHGKYYNKLAVFLEGEEVVSQLEEIEYYRDKSIRSVKIVIEPNIKPLSVVQGGIEDCGVLNGTEFIIDNEIRTSQVKLELAPEKGAAINSLYFPELSDEPLIGELTHGFYDDISYSPDWYSGHTVIYDRLMKKYTDLSPAQPAHSKDLYCPIRIPVSYKIEMPIGVLLKTYYVYHNSPRVDLSYHFSLNNFLPLSFRLGIATFNPKSFDTENIRYTTVNGGKTPEIYHLNGKTVQQDNSVSLGVSTHHCLGATEGWVDISDQKKGISIISRKSQLYSVPLVHYEEIKDSYFLRVYHTINEMDDTTETFMKGHNNIYFTFLGHNNDLNDIRRKSKCINQGLIMVPKK